MHENAAWIRQFFFQTVLRASPTHLFVLLAAFTLDRLSRHHQGRNMVMLHGSRCQSRFDGHVRVQWKLSPNPFGQKTSPIRSGRFAAEPNQRGFIWQSCVGIEARQTNSRTVVDNVLLHPKRTRYYFFNELVLLNTSRSFRTCFVLALRYLSGWVVLLFFQPAVSPTPCLSSRLRFYAIG